MWKIVQVADMQEEDRHDAARAERILTIGGY